MTDFEPAASTVAVNLPDRVGQATAIEQSRAVAEVHAAILVAQKCPRSVQNAIDEMRQSCAQKTLAERAFFRFPRGGATVSGPSVYLARELARTWGNVQHGISELRRDDEHGQSEMQAYAWDVQTNTRVVTTFVVPHMRDKKGGPEKLVDMRDIYENNANNGARRVRECIFGILPPWFVDEAKELCRKTLEDGGGVPLPKRIANLIDAFEELGVSKDQLERKIERPVDKWNAYDVGQLQVVGRSIKAGEIQRDEEFPPVRVMAADIIDQPTVPAAAPPAVPEANPAAAGTAPFAEPESRDAAAGVKAGRTQLPAITSALAEHGVTERGHILAVISLLVGDRIAALSDLSRDEASHVLNEIGRLTAAGNFADTVTNALAGATS